MFDGLQREIVIYQDESLCCKDLECCQGIFCKEIGSKGVDCSKENIELVFVIKGEQKDQKRVFYFKIMCYNDLKRSQKFYLEKEIRERNGCFCFLEDLESFLYKALV